MTRTQEILGEFIDYEAVSKIRAIQSPTIEKADIPQYIRCQNFDESLKKGEQEMDQYIKKVNDLQSRLDKSQNNIKSLERKMRRVAPEDPPSEPGSFSGPSETPENRNAYNRELSIYNARLEQTQRLQERISKANERHQNFVRMHNNAIRDADDKMETLAAAALLAIDADIAAVLDKATTIAKELADSENADDLMSALETCFTELRIFRAFAPHIEDSNAYRTASAKISEVNALCATLCANETVRNVFLDIYRQNSDLIGKNDELHTQVVEKIAGVDQKTLDEMTESFHSILNREFYTGFQYEGIVNPAELDNVVSEMYRTIDDLKDHIIAVTEFDNATRATAESVASVHQELEPILSTMKANVEAIGDSLLTKEHFVCEMLNGDVLERFYDPNLRDSVMVLRDYLLENIEINRFESIILETEDRFSVEKTEAAIETADILCLQMERAKVVDYVSKLSREIQDMEADIARADEVPKRDARNFKISTSLFYILSCLPMLGIAFAMMLRSKIDKFAPAFTTSLETYHQLGTAILKKNRTMQTVIFVLGLLLGFGGMGLLFGAGLGAKIAVSPNISALVINLVLPSVVLACYLVTWVILLYAGRSLRTYINSSALSSQ